MGSKDVLKETVAATVLEEVKNALRLDWLERKAPEDFEAMCALSAEKKQVLFAWCTAYALNQQLSTDNGAGPVFEQIGRRMRWSPRGAHNVAVTRAAVLDGRLSVSNAKNAA
ncbi:hypothetical protein [Hoeflea sp.]|uniref:hypothetical protein n=1 Tax=Hoeflea sp. TaxID=1940281 RepID=UPI003B02228C